jgi:hypothetical protein
MTRTSNSLGAIIVGFAYVTYLWKSACDSPSPTIRPPFHRYLLDNIRQNRFVTRARSFALTFIVLSGLAERDATAVLDVSKAFANEIPWQSISTKMIRRIIEMAIVYMDESVARSVETRLMARQDVELQMSRIVRTQIKWRFGAFDTADALAIDFGMKYFVDYEFVDEYFKGDCNELIGKVQEARHHYANALGLASPDFVEWRAHIEARLSRLVQRFDSSLWSARPPEFE